MTEELKIMDSIDSISGNLEDNYKFKSSSFLLMTLLVNLLFFLFLLLIRNPFNTSKDNYYLNLNTRDWFVVILLGVFSIGLLVLSVFKISLIDIERKPIMRGLQMDYFLKLVFLMLWIAMEYMTEGKGMLSAIFLLSAFVATSLCDIIVFCSYKNKCKAVIIDWNKKLIDKKYYVYKTSDIRYSKHIPALLILCIITTVAIGFFSNIIYTLCMASASPELAHLYKTGYIVVNTFVFISTLIIFLTTWGVLLYYYSSIANCKISFSIRVLSLIISTLLTITGYVLFYLNLINQFLVMVMFVVFMAPLLLMVLDYVITCRNEKFEEQKQRFNSI